MKDYYKNETTTLTPRRAAAVHMIANKLCAVRDRLKSTDFVKTVLYKWNGNKMCWDELREIWVGRLKSNSILAEAVNDALPRQFKNRTFQLVVHGKRSLGYRYTV